MLLIVNPRASSLADGHRQRVVASLDAAYSVKSVETEGQGHAKELCRAAAEDGYDLVAVLGGDGTLSEAADGLAGSPTPLTSLPAGCTNAFARSLGIPEATTAAERLAARAGRLRPRAIDLGVVNGRHFLFASGVGLSASIVGAADSAPERKAAFGQLHFFASAASVIARRYVRNPPRMRVEADGRSANGIVLAVQNSDPLTYFGPREIRVCEHAGLDTGTISMTLLREARVRDIATILPRVLSGRGSAVVGHPLNVGFSAIPEARVTSIDGVPLPVEADGEFLGEHHTVEYRAAPAALRVVA
jgi:diacylglycerol kinase family enzyme